MALLMAIGLVGLMGCASFEVDHSDDDWPEDCPDPDDPAVEYFHASFADALACDQMDFVACSQGWDSIPDRCGCGCMDGWPRVGSN